ncbi:Gfo/Idh/MocA family protein [Lichenibacterium ramalinae]|uniref:Gfo/Idh/MocA family oxidoreductase n=1 Tax=Lichenibacterium ramalinae TaxID=2316527 RepID=A0A4Q2R646_9HYPH|nr:Gfo/Idh/MocA family oxidoreductase [Lichenibacterium ramalinae]RYB01832.1 gfo/Idh/MocA family oxidoreductase [Lichenibacterium ramalinae]
MTVKHDGRRIRLGMVGGGEGAFIGAVHRIAARLDDRYDLVAGALSSTPDKSARSAAALGLARSYPDFASMAREEAAHPDGIEAVSIVTPNHLHAAASHAFLDAGIHVICDKPLTTTLEEARALADHARRSGLVFALTHNYTGYPMVRQAREMVRAGKLGTLRVVQVEYAQDWLAEPFEDTGNKQAGWRTDPARAGAGGCIGDIGTHAFNLAAFVTGLAAEEVSAELTTFVPGRRLDDDVRAMLRYAGGARGALWASQVAVGEENEVRLRVYGTAGGLDWCQSDANRLAYTPLGGVRQILTRNGAGAGEANRRASRVPAGHPEGYLEGFATIYSDAADAIVAARTGSSAPGEPPFPSVTDGVAGLAFIDAAVRSSTAGGSWTRLGPASAGDEPV